MCRIYHLVVGTLFGVLASPLALVAQTAWSLTTAEGQPAVVQSCPMPLQSNGSFLCLGVSCDAQQGWALEMSVGGGAPPDQLPTFLSIDGRDLGPLGFGSAQDVEGARVYLTLLNEPRHMMMLDAVKRGTQARLTAVIGQTGYAYDFSLEGAGTALDQLAATCGTQPPHIAARIAAQKAKESVSCPNVSFDESFAHVEDINQDGIPDLDFDSGAVLCGGSRWYCGSGGCSHTLLIGQPDGSFSVLIENALLRGYATPVPGYIDLHLHGSFCGKVGAEWCVKRHKIEVGPGYVRLGEAQLVPQ